MHMYMNIQAATTITPRVHGTVPLLQQCAQKDVYTIYMYVYKYKYNKLELAYCCYREVIYSIGTGSICTSKE